MAGPLHRRLRRRFLFKVVAMGAVVLGSASRPTLGASPPRRDPTDTRRRRLLATLRRHGPELGGGR